MNSKMTIKPFANAMMMMVLRASMHEKKEIISYLVFDLWHVMDAEHVSFGLLSNLNFPCLSSTQVHPTEQWKNLNDSMNRPNRYFCHRRPLQPFWCSFPVRKTQIWYRRMSAKKERRKRKIHIGLFGGIFFVSSVVLVFLVFFLYCLWTSFHIV